jgi:hypothetical protein
VEQISVPRDVDEKKTRKALRKLHKLVARAEAEGVELTDWEKEFVGGLAQRLNKYGSAFADPNQGSLDEAISFAQNEIMKQLDKKTRGKTSGGFTTRKPLGSNKTKPLNTFRGRDIHEDIEPPEERVPVSEDSSDAVRPDNVFSIVRSDVRRASDMAGSAPDQEKKKRPEKPPVKEQNLPGQKVSPFRVIKGGKAD